MDGDREQQAPTEAVTMINNCEELAKWCDGAEEEFGDPSIPVCQLFVRWVDTLILYRGTDLVAGMMEGDLFLKLHPHIEPLQIPLEQYEFKRATSGVYAMTPSLNIPGVLHGYVVLFEVPDRAKPPWESLVVLATSL